MNVPLKNSAPPDFSFHSEGSEVECRSQRLRERATRAAKLDVMAREWEVLNAKAARDPELARMHREISSVPSHCQRVPRTHVARATSVTTDRLPLRRQDE